MIYGKQEPERSSSGHHGDVAAGFLDGCLPFTVTATLTVAIRTLDIITDWIMYRAFVDIAFGERVQTALGLPWYNDTQNVIWLYRELYFQLPLLLRSFCIVGLVVYVCYFLWMCWMFTIERRKFKDIRDGLPHKGSFVENYGSDFFILLHVLLYDLPVSAILFGAQVAVSCRFLVNFNHVIFFIATIVTLVSLVWNVLQTFYNGSCLGFREDFLSTRFAWTLRCISILTAMLAVTFASLNVILLTGWHTKFVKGTVLRSEIMDKIAVDQWLEKDRVMFWGNQSTEFTLSNRSNSTYNVIEVVNLKEVFASGDQGLIVQFPCEGDTYSLMSFLQVSHRNVRMTNCTAIFRFVASTQEPVINFDYLYTFYSEDRHCVQSTFINGEILSPMPALRQPKLPEHLIDSRRSNGGKALPDWSKPEPEDATHTSRPSTAAHAPIRVTGSPSSLTTTEPSLVEYHVIWITETSRMGCDYVLVQNTSMFSGSLCDS